MCGVTGQRNRAIHPRPYGSTRRASTLRTSGNGFASAQEHRELVCFLVEAKDLRAEVKRLRDVLEEIRQSHGNACRDSHAAWEIVNKALRETKGVGGKDSDVSFAMIELDACGFLPGDKVRHGNGWYIIDRIYKAREGGLRVVLRTRFGRLFEDSLDSVSKRDE
jgi:hypothetical protein